MILRLKIAAIALAAAVTIGSPAQPAPPAPAEAAPMPTLAPMLRARVIKPEALLFFPFGTKA